MELIFLDTSFLVAYYNADDVNHTDARKLVREMEGTKISFLTSDYIFDETLTILLVRAGKEKAIKVCNTLLKDIEAGDIKWMRVNEEVFRKSTEIFTRFVDKKWSFTDCTSYILMKDSGIKKGASFDEHFRQFGFETLPQKQR
ncbi:type II toxin-antitoxin system VapC family toxin [Candidatus Poribacteria bacterium]|nr:type II toxin-antitoxin system VapC family toxin [Candidatus Poribacteria bacterium]